MPEIFQLPKPSFEGKFSLEEAIKKRRSERDFKERALTKKELSQILWAAQGITGEKWQILLRSVPSAGALYPLEIYVVIGKIEDFESGIYHYRSESHSLEKILNGDKREKLTEAALGQESILKAPITLVISAVFERTTLKYGERGKGYVLIEAGHTAQNAILQATSLGLAACPIGAFDDETVSKVLNLKKEETPLYILPIGYPR